MTDNPETNDWVDFVLDKSLDLVDLIYDNAHARVCRDYKPFINKHGSVFCEPCGISVSSLSDPSANFCRRCDHPKPVHNYDTGACVMCGNICGTKVLDPDYQ